MEMLDPASLSSRFQNNKLFKHTSGDGEESFNFQYSASETRYPHGYIPNAFEKLKHLVKLTDPGILFPNRRLQISRRPRLHQPLPTDESRVYKIPSVLAGRIIANSLGDSGARFNFMKEGFARRSGLSINRNAKMKVRIGSDKMVTTAGTIETSYQFTGESEKHTLVFQLLPKCLHDIILGNPFLKAAETFTKRSSRIKEGIIKGIVDRDFLYLGSLGPRFHGTVNGVPQEALADSGAKIMVMDEDYAQRKDLPIVRDDMYRTRLRFADDSTANTSGM